MKQTILRGILAFLLAAVLVGLHPPAPTRAGTGGHWTDLTPQLDGVATSAEWGSAALLNYSHFSVRYQNDGQFLYILLDVTGETPASPPALSSTEFFSLSVDTDGDNIMESVYDLNYPSIYLRRGTSTDGIHWTPGASCVSYGTAGFGPSLGSVTPHRIYEMALRLSEMNVQPGGSRTMSFIISSNNPPFQEFTTSTALAIKSPYVAYIYNGADPNGLSDGNTFTSGLYASDGISADLMSLDYAASSVDLSSYTAIIMADDTGASSTWLGSPALANKIQQSKRPVVGIGEGGIDLLGTLGSFINHGNSATANNVSQVTSFAPQHSAWSTPSIVSTTSPVTLYTTNVSALFIFTGIGSNFPWKTMTRQAVRTTNSNQSPILSQSLNGTCYTLWGFSGAPSLLTTDGKNLLANLIWQPPCLPAVLYLRGNDGVLAADVYNLLTLSGFPYQVNFAADAASLDYSGFHSILIGWDSNTSWSSAANVQAVVDSHLPVTGMGYGGIVFLLNAGLPMATSFMQIPSGQTQVTLRDPLQPVARYPYPISAISYFRIDVDSTAGGVDTWEIASELAPSETVIGYYIANFNSRVVTTQPKGSTCYQFYGLASYPNNMTEAGKNLLRNMLVHPTCNYPIFLPMLTK